MSDRVKRWELNRNGCFSIVVLVRNRELVSIEWDPSYTIPRLPQIPFDRGQSYLGKSDGDADAEESLILGYKLRVSICSP